MEMWLAYPELGTIITSQPWVVDGLDTAEGGSLRFLNNLANADAELALLAATFPWLEGGVSSDEKGAADGLQAAASEDPELAMFLASLPAITEPVPEDFSALITGLRSLWQTNPGFARLVSTLPWAVDGLAGAESDALDNFTMLAGGKSGLAGKVVEWPWFTARITINEANTLGALAGLSGIDPELAHTVADVAWVKDGPGPLGAPALLYLHRMSESSVALAKSVASATWFTDHVSLNERQAIERLTELSHAHSVTADTIARHPLLLEGLLADTGSTVHSLQRMAELDEALAGDLLTLLWLHDGLTQEEHDVIRGMVHMLVRNAEAATLVSETSWFREGITRDRSAAVNELLDLTIHLPSFASEVASRPWFTDDISGTEVRALNWVRFLAEGDPELARTAINMPWVQGDWSRDLGAYGIIALGKLSRRGENAWQDVKTQPWFVDGISAQEAAFMLALSHVGRGAASEIFRNLLDKRYELQHRMWLPLGGSATIWVVSPNPLPLDQTLVTELADTAKLLEEFLSVPFPTSDIVLLLTPLRPWYSEGYTGDSIQLRTTRVGRSAVHPISKHIAHYYFNLDTTGRYWLEQGAAHFTASLLDVARGETNIERRQRDTTRRSVSLCEDIRTVENIRHHIHERGLRSQCLEYLGERLLTGLYVLMEREGLAAALREVLSENLPQQRTPIDSPEFTQTEDRIYQIFLDHSPIGREEDFTAFYREVHGGPYAAPGVDFDDDHSDDAVSASYLSLGMSASGELNYAWDYDFFRFTAQAGTIYEFKVRHEDLRAPSVNIFSGNEVERLGTVFRGRRHANLHVIWEANATGTHYIAIQNFGGKTGEYTLVFKEFTSEPDDHGDTIAMASEITIGDSVRASIDYSYDFDIFRLEVPAGVGHSINIWGGTLKRVGFAVFVRGHGAGRLIGALGAPAYDSSRVYYIIVQSTDDSLGTYTVFVD